MKIRILRYGCLAALLTASTWAVCGADDIAGRRVTPPAALKRYTKPAIATVAVADQEPETARPSTTKPSTSLPGATSRIGTPTIVTQAAPKPATPTVAPTSRIGSTTTTTTPSPVAPLPPRSPIAETGSTIVTAPEVPLSLSTLSPTPEMWFYERMRQDYDNPALQARLRGERAAAERRARLAARAWYGVSNGRPTAHVTPFMYYYSPTWSSNVVNPFLWTQPRTTPIIIEARRPVVGVSGFGVW